MKTQLQTPLRKDDGLLFSLSFSFPFLVLWVEPRTARMEQEPYHRAMSSACMGGFVSQAEGCLRKQREVKVWAQ